MFGGADININIAPDENIALGAAVQVIASLYVIKRKFVFKGRLSMF